VKVSKRGQPLLVFAMLGCMLCSRAADPIRASSDPTRGHTPGQVTGAPRTHAVDPPEVDSPRGPQLVPDEQAPVAADLQRLAKLFVRYAVGGSDTFPHWESVSMAIGGQPVMSIDDIAAALSHREIWKTCPADWEVYGASSSGGSPRSNQRRCCERCLAGLLSGVRRRHVCADQERSATSRTPSRSQT
jgi:hypothetical protein